MKVKLTDMDLSMLSNYIEAMGRELKITAEFLDDSIQIEKFENLASSLRLEAVSFTPQQDHRASELDHGEEVGCAAFRTRDEAARSSSASRTAGSIFQRRR